MTSHFITGLFARVFIAVFSLLTLVICSRYLGSGVLGEMNLVILNVAIIQAINDIYSGPSLVYFVPRGNLRSLYRQGLVWTVSCVLPLSLLFYIFGIGSASRWVDVLAISLLACGTGLHNVLLLGSERIRSYYFLLFLQPAIMCGSLATCVLAAGLDGSDPYLLSLYISWTVTFAASLILVLGQLNDSDPNAPGGHTSAVVVKGVVNQLGNLAHILSNRFNYYILSVTAAVGVYASATSLIESVWIVSAAVSPVLLTHVANRRDEHLHRTFTLRLARACLVISALCVLIVLLVPAEFFIWLLGPDFSEVKTTMLLLSPGVIAISYSSVISHYFSGKGKQHILLSANACGLVVALSLSYMLISRYGLAGAAATASLAYMAQAVFLVLRFRSGVPADNLPDSVMQGGLPD
jgi:O-antigen/teichoic acid export membrane protein